MANDISLPNMQEPLAPGGKPPTSAYRKFFEKLSRQTGLTAEQSAAIEALAERVTELEEAGEDFGSILGLGSVSVVGSLGDQVIVQLEGDEESPAATHYYGTDIDGVKGYHALAVDPELVYTRITSEGDIRVAGDGSLRITD